MPFAIKKGRFKLSTPAKCTSHVKLSKGGQSTNIKSLKIQNVLRPWNQILAYKTMLWMSVVRTLAWCFHILEMSSIHTGEHTKQQRFKSKRRKIVNGKDCVTFHRTTAYHCCHSLHAFTGSCEKFSFLRYDSWSELPWKYETGQNRMRTFPKTPVIFLPALVSLALSAPLLRFSREFRVWST